MSSPGKFFLVAAAVVLAYVGIRNWYFTPNVLEEGMAVDFSATLVDGQPFQLSELEGEFTFLEFWGSWCAPCRNESASVAFLKQAYPKLQMVSVGVERDSAAWRKAISDLQKDWPRHIMDGTGSLKFLDGPIADLYGVNKVPTHFLIDPNGQVVSTSDNLYEIQRILQFHYARRD